ncbi:unnamed protein product [Clonostachys rosea]|uniref:Transcription factor domain-containing protein n=1 Tax=Bionectria ochroleuca TaxID=29856 RepID=A0ABY6UHH2_BIOOC|nr:unnamed protein product [Clonostachys rosea]
MSQQFQFVRASKPTGRTSSKSRKSNHSHVMRHVHARKRRLRTQRYQDELMNAGIEEGQTNSQIDFTSPPIPRFASSGDPFSSLARPLSSEEYFLLDHFVCPVYSRLPDLTVDIRVVMPYSIGHCGLFDYDGDHQSQMLREWVGLAINDEIFMTVAILLSTCRYVLQGRPGDPFFTRMVLCYKQICLRALRLEIESKPICVNAMSVAKALALAIDEVNSGEHSIARKHLQGVLAMVEFSGGPRSIGLTSLLERMYRIFLRELPLPEARTEQIDLAWKVQL